MPVCVFRLDFLRGSFQRARGSCARRRSHQERGRFLARRGGKCRDRRIVRSLVGAGGAANALTGLRALLRWCGAERCRLEWCHGCQISAKALARRQEIRKPKPQHLPRNTSKKPLFSASAESVGLPPTVGSFCWGAPLGGAPPGKKDSIPGRLRFRLWRGFAVNRRHARACSFGTVGVQERSEGVFRNAKGEALVSRAGFVAGQRAAILRHPAFSMVAVAAAGRGCHPWCASGPGKIRCSDFRCSRAAVSDFDGAAVGAPGRGDFALRREAVRRFAT